MSAANVALAMPYPGLRPFEAEDQPLFFGREAQVSGMLRQLEDQRFVAVVGSSGSGKSSLVRAGLFPAVREGFLLGTTDWVTIVIKPGHQPYQRLVRALYQATRVEGDASAFPAEDAPLTLEETATLTTLRRTDRGLLTALGELAISSESRVILVVDQFEELFAFRRAGVNRGTVASRDESAAFVGMLLRSASEPAGRVWAILTMRSDFIGDCEAFLGLPEQISRSQFLVPRLDRGQMEEAIVRPSAVEEGAFKTFTFEEGLVNRIINEAGDRPDQLPLMQHALMRTWKRAVARAGGGNGPLAVTPDDYEAAGGIEKALSLHADAAWDEIKGDPKKAHLTRRLFLLLCDISADGQITRRRPKVDEVQAVTGASVAEIEQVIRVYQQDDRNFLLPPPPQRLTAESYLDISHEALLRQWRLFADEWQEQEGRDASELRRLVELASLRKQNQEVGLLPARDLDRIDRWKQRVSPEWARRYVTQNEWVDTLAFVEDSQAEVKREEEVRRNEARRKRVLGAAVALLLAVATLVAYNEWCKQWGDWTEEFKVDFSQAPPLGLAFSQAPPADAAQTQWLKENFLFQNQEATSEVRPWAIKNGAMVMKQHEWCWLNVGGIRGDTKVVVDLRFAGKPEAFQICINAKKKLRQWDNNPPGYSCRFGIWEGSMDLITRNDSDRKNDFTSLLVNSTLQTGGAGSGNISLTFQQQGEAVLLRLNGKDVHRDTYLLPLLGESTMRKMDAEYYENIGIRTWGENVEVLKVSAYQFKLPEKASPIVAGDTLAEAGYLDEAIKKYKAIAKDYQKFSSPIYALALTKGYLLADHLEDADSRNWCYQGLKKLEGHIRSHPLASWFHPGQSAECAKYWERLREVETLRLWKKGDYWEALGNFPAIFKANPETRIVLECLRANHQHLEAEVSQKLLRGFAETFAHTPELAGLDISSFGMTNLGALAAVPSLRGLDCRNNRLTSLDPLQSMDQLRALYCGQNRIGTLEPIRALKLIELSCDDNQLENLEPLSSMQLNTLYCSENRIKDLSPLKGMPIYALDCSHNNISLLDPISDLPGLLELYCGSNQISSLEPLRKVKNLQYLDCSTNEIQTLEPLKELDLYTLDCSGNPIVTLEPFVDAKNPPGIFAFDDCKTLPETEIERAIKVWESKSLRWNASYGKFALARKRGDAQVKKLAQSDAGHRYLFVQKYLTADEAEQFCKRLGGHLVTITSEPEKNFLKAITPPDASCRIGIEVSEGKPRWVTGEGIDTEFVSAALTDFRPTDKIVTWKNGSLLPSQEDKPMPFIIEWDSN